MSDLTREAAKPGVEIAIRPMAQALGCGGGRTTVHKPMHSVAHKFEKLIEMFLALLPADDGPEIEFIAVGKGVQLAEKKVAMVEILGGGLQEKKRAVRLRDALDEEGDGDIHANVKQQELEMLRAMADQRAEPAALLGSARDLQMQNAEPGLCVLHQAPEGKLAVDLGLKFAPVP